VFDALGERLANQFVVRYDSQQRGHSRVRVEAYTDRSAPWATATYVAPMPGPALAGRERRRVDSFWLSASAVPAVTALCALLLALAAGLLVRRRPGNTLSARLSSFAAAPPVEEPVGRPWTPVGRMASILERRVSAGERWQRFAEDVDVARMKRSAAEIALLTGLGGLASVALLLVLGLPELLLLPLALVGGVLGVIRFRAGRQRRAFEQQLPDNLQVLGSALRAGHSFTGALGTVVEGAPEPIRRELARAQTDEQLGVPIDEALLRVGRRMRTEDVTQVAVVAALQQEAGGNTAEVLDRVVESLRERHALRRLVRSLTAQGRMSQMVVTALPFGLAAAISLLNPGYLDPLLQTGVGRVLIGGALVMTGIGAIAIKRIVEIKI
jgi:tight adherence protein B